MTLIMLLDKFLVLTYKVCVDINPSSFFSNQQHPSTSWLLDANNKASRPNGRNDEEQKAKSTHSSSSSSPHYGEKIKRKKNISLEKEASKPETGSNHEKEAVTSIESLVEKTRGNEERNGTSLNGGGLKSTSTASGWPRQPKMTSSSAEDNQESDSKVSMVAVMPPKEFLEKMYAASEVETTASPKPKRKKKTLSERRLLKKVAQLLDTRNYDDVDEVRNWEPFFIHTFF